MSAEAEAIDGALGVALEEAARRKAAQSGHAAIEGRAVDEQHPWLGLDSFSEETRAYFYGREQEVAELSRRVQRKLLTVLFGQSGLGKTSILRAGIVPKLRPNGYCPVYVRIDYARESPPPADQIKAAIFRATQAHGEWTQAGSAIEGESLWEFLHHRGDFLRDAEGRTVVPLLIFDQFEEIFTLAQADDAGKRRAAQFLEELADLVENRPPKELEARIDSDDAVSDRFDFARADYRILIALREDYLAHLESVKGTMPSITQNRMRLARMTGQQALAAVVKPGGKLVSEEVAESIVRFIAGGSEIPNAEVEPSLLSLICRELNNARIAQGRAEISVDLLAGSKETILTEFYERALADQPAAVRRFIEDEMLTDSGYRESLAEERVRKAFNAAGAAPDALAKLVDRRLLRVEERLDLRRVELTHDVLCKVVGESRDLRHAREAQEQAELSLAEQKAREEQARRSLVRARQVAAVCAVLAIGAVASAIWGIHSMNRAREAEARALQTRQMAEAARGQAEKLIVYLLDDFYLELEPIGRLDVVADLAKRAIDYYAALPAELRSAETDRNRALALVRYGYVLRYQAKLDEALKVLTEASDSLGRLHAAGDRTEATGIGLALGLSARARALNSMARDTEALALAERSRIVLEPLISGPSASVSLRRAYANVMLYLGFLQMRLAQEQTAIETLGSSRAVFRGIDDLSLKDLPAAAAYAEASSWYMEALARAGRLPEARNVGEEARAVAERILETRPGHMGAVRSHALIVSLLSGAEAEELRLRAAIPLGEASARDWEILLKLDPTNAVAWGNLVGRYALLGFMLERTGRLDAALGRYRQALDIERRSTAGSSLHVLRALVMPAARRALLESDLGNRGQAERALADLRRVGELAAAAMPRDSAARSGILEFARHFEVLAAIGARDYGAAHQAGVAAIRRVEALKPSSVSETREHRALLARLHRSVAWASYHLGDYASAEREIRQAISYRQQLPRVEVFDKLDGSFERVTLALAVARQGRNAEAAKLVDPEIRFHRELLAGGSEDFHFQHVALARALYAGALASPGEARALLAEAAAILDRLPGEMRRRRSIEDLRAWIGAEMAKRS